MRLPLRMDHYRARSPRPLYRLGRHIGNRIARDEATLLNPNAAHQELKHAKDLAKAINTGDADNPNCQ